MSKSKSNFRDDVLILITVTVENYLNQEDLYLEGYNQDSREKNQVIVTLANQFCDKYSSNNFAGWLYLREKIDDFVYNQAIKEV